MGDADGSSARHLPLEGFHHFGGAPQTLVIDNLKAAVTKADWFDPELNPKIQSFCAHYDTTVLPTKPYTPRHKGKVERGVDYVQNNALKGRSFASLNEQNEHLLQWETTVADDQRLGHAAEVPKGILDTTDELLGALPEHHLAVGFARMAQHDAKDMRTPTFAVRCHDRGTGAEVDLSLFARSALHSSEG